MKRFVELRVGCDFLVLDCKNQERPIVVCRCEGFNAPLNAEYVSAALQSYHDNLIEKVMGDDLQPILDTGDFGDCGSEGC